VTALGRPTKVTISYPSDIDDLVKAVKMECANALRDVDAGRLQVYPAGTLVPVGDGLDPGDGIPAGTTSKSALIVVAPAPMQQDNGEC
jgi:hypothetical protein